MIGLAKNVELYKNTGENACLNWDIITKYPNFLNFPDEASYNL